MWPVTSFQEDGDVVSALCRPRAAKGTKKAPGPLFGTKSHEWSALALGVTWWDLHMNGEPRLPSPLSRSISVDDLERIGPRRNGAAFAPGVAAAIAAPKANRKDRRADVQIPRQLGMAHGTDRHQRTPNENGWPAGSDARSTSRIGDSGETAREGGARQSTVRQRNDTKRTVVGEKRKRDEIRTRRQRCPPEGRARRGRTRGTRTPNTEAD